LTGIALVQLSLAARPATHQPPPTGTRNEERPLDRIQSMEVFVKVAQAGSLSAAAQTLGFSKSTVSKHLSALEEHLGVLLVNRTTRRLSLTELGAAYRDHAQRILAEIEETELAIQEHTVEPKGRLKVSAPMSFGILHLAPLLPGFMTAHPRIEVELSLDDRRIDLIDDGFDLAIRIGRLEDSTLLARRLASVHFVCAAADRYLDRHRPIAHPDDLAAHNCLRYTLGRQPHDWHFSRGEEASVVKVSGTLAANNGDALREAAVGGLGIIYQPVFIIDADLRARRLKPLLEDWRTPTIDIHAVFPEQRRLQPKLRRFVDYLADAFKRPDIWPCAAASAPS
jgi:DNA-binding transcriptional LysR family regulator